MTSPTGDVDRLFGAIEAGGTKFICAIGTRDGTIVDRTRIATREPSVTLAEVVSYFGAARQRFGALSALGVGSFGPLDLRPSSATFGFITRTPKAGWAQVDLAGALRRALGLPVRLDTDVNAAALGEGRWGAGRGLESLAYVTVGTGIGVGVVHHGRPVHGLMHPEMGHFPIRRHPDDASFEGLCPYHGDCLEGLASGPAIVARTGAPLEQASPDHPIWAVQADYLGQLCAMLVLGHSPQRIVVGGGAMQPVLHGKARERMLFWLNGYVAAEELLSPDYVVPPGLGAASGIQGALMLAVTGSLEQAGGVSGPA